MKTITSVAAVALMLGLAACNERPTAPAGTAPVSGATRTVALIEKPRLSADMEALPRVVGDSPAIKRINAELDRLDAAATASAKECTETAGDGPGGAWSRTITRPMTGPAYVTLREHVEVDCGGAYPSTTQTAITYDLSTGARANWSALLPALALVQDEPMAELPADYVYTVHSPQLEALYERKMIADADDAEWRDECREVWKPKPDDEAGGQGFNVWADAEHGGVAIDADYVHAVQACGGTVYLSPEEMRAAGAPAALIDALAAAKTAGNWAPKEEAGAAE